MQDHMVLQLIDRLFELSTYFVKEIVLFLLKYFTVHTSTTIYNYEIRNTSFAFIKNK